MKPSETRRDKRVVTFLVEEDYVDLTALAARRNISVSALANELVSESLQEKRLSHLGSSDSQDS